MEAILLLVMGVLNILCFIIGAKVGQAVVKGEEVKVPNLSPLQAYKEHSKKREAEKEQSKLDTILQNIERYDGTSQGQQDVG